MINEFMFLAKHYGIETLLITADCNRGLILAETSYEMLEYFCRESGYPAEYIGETPEGIWILVEEVIYA